MARKNPTSTYKIYIKNMLKDTFINRRQWILEKSPTIEKVFSCYPRLQDYNGEMVR